MQHNFVDIFFSKFSVFFQARPMDLVFISLETLDTLLITLGVVAMEVATCTLPKSSLGSIVLEILQ